MTIGIYAILNLTNGKRYIGKSSNIEARWWSHNNALMKDEKPKDCNRHLFNAVKKYGLLNFEYEILEKFDILNEDVLKEAELTWMEFYQSCDRKFGYNLRKDTLTNCIVHEDTIKLMKEIFKGKNNPNYNNKWSDDQKKRMSEKQKERYKTFVYTVAHRKTIGDRTREMWKDDNLRSQMSYNVSKAKTTHDFYKYDMQYNLLKIYSSIHEIIKENPTYKWQNIYAACNGNKPTYMGFQWARRPKNLFI